MEDQGLPSYYFCDMCSKKITVNKELHEKTSRHMIKELETFLKNKTGEEGYKVIVVDPKDSKYNNPEQHRTIYTEKEIKELFDGYNLKGETKVSPKPHP